MDDKAFEDFRRRNHCGQVSFDELELRCYYAEEDRDRLRKERDMLRQEVEEIQESAKVCLSCGFILPHHAEDCGRYPAVVEQLRQQLDEARAKYKELWKENDRLQATFVDLNLEITRLREGLEKIKEEIRGRIDVCNTLPEQQRAYKSILKWIGDTPDPPKCIRCMDLRLVQDGKGGASNCPECTPDLETCPDCEGSGETVVGCPTCEGTGDAKIPHGSMDCQDCEGSGLVHLTKSASDWCPTCKGTGKKGD